MAISDTPIFDFGLRRFRQVYSGKTVAYDHIIKRIRRDKGDPAYDGFLSSPRIPFGEEGSTFDPDALDYINTASIVNLTEQEAVNQLVLDLKGLGDTTNNTNVWDDSYSIYPLSPTSLVAASFNLKDPTLNISWFNSPIHSTTGITGDGINKYGNTNWNPTTIGADINNIGLTYSGEYSLINGSYVMGCFSDGRFLTIRNLSSAKTSYLGSSAAAASALSLDRNITTANRTSLTQHELYFDGVLADTDNNSNSNNIKPNADVFILAFSNAGTASTHFSGEIDFVAIHKGLSANQTKDLADSIAKYNLAVR